MSRLAITYEGLQLLLADLRIQGFKPAAIVLSPNDKRDLKMDIKARSKHHTKAAEKADADLREIAWIGSVPVTSHPNIAPGTARIIDRRNLRDRNADHRIVPTQKR